MKLQQEKILTFIQEPATVHLYDSIDSTNNEAKRRAAVDRGIHLYVSAHQTAGRGRHAHTFYSPRDTGLYMTLALPLSTAPADIQRLTCAAAVAVCDAVSALGDSSPRIKWVNDIYVNDKKAAGILAELITDTDNRPCAVIIGIGLNLNTADFPDEIADKAGNFGVIDHNALCGTVADNLITLYQRLDDNSIMEKYRALNLCIGRTISYTKDGCEHIAAAVDINADGGLVVEENGVFTALHSGEISVKME